MANVSPAPAGPRQSRWLAIHDRSLESATSSTRSRQCGAAVREVPGLVSAEFFTRTGLDILVAHAGLAPPLRVPAPAYLLLEASGPGALDNLADVIGDRQAAVGESAADRARLWSYRERHPEAAGFLGVPIKLDVSVPAAQWVRLASEAAAVITGVDPGAQVITFGHVADGNVHVNIVPAAPADGRHENAVFSLVASLGGSISAEHGIGALKARWLPLARTDAERALFARIRSAFDPSATLNPNVLPRLSKYCRDVSGRRARSGQQGKPSGRGGPARFNWHWPASSRHCPVDLPPMPHPHGQDDDGHWIGVPPGRRACAGGRAVGRPLSACGRSRSSPSGRPRWHRFGPSGPTGLSAPGREAPCPGRRRTGPPARGCAA